VIRRVADEFLWCLATSARCRFCAQAVASGMIFALDKSWRRAVDAKAAGRHRTMMSSSAIDNNNLARSDSSGDGEVASIRGSVVEVRFPLDGLPSINEALDVIWDGEGRLTLEVQSHIDDRHVRAVAMNKTSGLARGTKVRRTRAPIAVPVG
jgi:hypothetical protein